MSKVKIELEIEDINTIVEALGQQPFVKVYKLIEKLHIQSSSQLQQNGTRTDKHELDDN